MVALQAVAAKKAKGGKGAKTSGKEAMSVVLGAVAKRDGENISKRLAAASGGKTKKAKTSGTSGEEATFSCEWSREQFMGRTGAASKGTTKRFF